MLDAMRQEAQQVITSVVALIPGLFGAIILLLIGWLLASFLKMLVSRITHSINHFLREYYSAPAGKLSVSLHPRKLYSAR